MNVIWHFYLCRCRRCGARLEKETFTNNNKERASSFDVWKVKKWQTLCVYVKFRSPHTTIFFCARLRQRSGFDEFIFLFVNKSCSRSVRKVFVCRFFFHFSSIAVATHKFVFDLEKRGIFLRNRKKTVCWYTIPFNWTEFLLENVWVFMLLYFVSMAPVHAVHYSHDVLY